MSNDIYKVVEALAGEIVSNKAKVMLDGKWLVIARVMGGVLSPTADFEVAEAAAAALAAVPEDKPAKADKGGKAGKKAPAPDFVPQAPAEVVDELAGITLE